MKQKPSHVIAEIRYHPGLRGDDGDIVCVCGWKGQVRDFQPHRQAEGDPRIAAPARSIAWPGTWR